MPKFRKKPVIIEAEQFTKESGLVKGLCVSCYCGISTNHVHTIHGGQVVFVKFDDWIIPEPDGEHFYPCKPDIFRATYEEVHGDGIVD